jgi:hypothetical protein
MSGCARLWDISDPYQPHPLSTLTGHTSAIYSVAFSRDGHTLATTSVDGTARLWDISDPHQPHPLNTLTGHTSAVTRWRSAPTGTPWPPAAPTAPPGCGKPTSIVSPLESVPSPPPSPTASGITTCPGWRTTPRAYELAGQTRHCPVRTTNLGNRRGYEGARNLNSALQNVVGPVDRCRLMPP